MLAAKQQQQPHPPSRAAAAAVADAVDRAVSRKSATPAAITAAAKYPRTPVRDLAAYAPVAPTSTPAAAAGAAAPKTGVAVGTVVGGKWRVARTLGQGAFGQTFAANELTTGRAVAIKIETTPAAPATATAPAKSYLQFETAILRRLQGCPHVSQLVGSGMVPGPPGGSESSGADAGMQHYMVMSLHGENLSELRKRMPGHRFTPETTAMLARQMISAIRYMHKIGYLHRDIKASNFVMGTEQLPDHHGVPRARCYLIDFGLARRFLTSDGQIRPPRSSAGFRGTARYASLNAHENKELARRDDLWSVLYLLVEFLTGALPWRREKDRHAVYQQKKRIPLAHLLVGTPKWLHDLAAHISSLEFTAEPDYAKLMTILDTVTAPNRHVLYDWEKSPADLARDLGNAARTLPPALADASIGIALAQAALAPPTPPPAARAEPTKDHAAHVATLHQLLDGIARIEAAQIDRWVQQMAEARGDAGTYRTLAEHVRDLLNAGRAPRDVVRHVLGGKATPRVIDAADRIDQVRAEARNMRVRIRAAAAAGTDPREATGCGAAPVTIERATTPAALDAEHSGQPTPATLPRAGAAASVASVASVSSTTSPRMLGRLRKWLGGIRGKSTAAGTTATAPSTTTTTVPTVVRRRMTPAVVHADSKWDAPSEQMPPVTMHHRAVPAAAPATFPRVAGVKPAGGLLAKLIPRGGKKGTGMRRARAGSAASAAAASSSAAPLM
ncbi:Tau-tubulin kinase 1 [Allomyces javanicus]|nr:Tau-tubulin kinase 1 [Allomyces javanicus]